jgi:AcrR family transcriptional regulator
LLDAATQVLQTSGQERFTTNKVAEAAGFSIGTLYQYFPDKTAIIVALAEREQVRAEAEIAKALTKADPQNLEAVIRTVVRAGIGAFGGRRRVRKFVILTAIRLDLEAGAMRIQDKIGQTFIQAIMARSADHVRPLSDTIAFIFTRAIVGSIRMAVLKDRPMLETREFEDELVRLALGYLRP